MCRSSLILASLKDELHKANFNLWENSFHFFLFLFFLDVLLDKFIQTGLNPRIGFLFTLIISKLNEAALQPVIRRMDKLKVTVTAYLNEDAADFGCKKALLPLEIMYSALLLPLSPSKSEKIFVWFHMLCLKNNYIIGFDAQLKAWLALSTKHKIHKNKLFRSSRVNYVKKQKTNHRTQLNKTKL